MKSAVCMYGIVGGKKGKNGKGGPVDIKACSKTIFKNVIIPNNSDVFIHTWSIEHKDYLNKIYAPKKALYQEQEYFGAENDPGKFLGYSRWTSNNRVLDLKAQCERENNFTYDMVMVCRFDVMFSTLVDFAKYDPKNFYASNWNEFKLWSRAAKLGVKEVKPDKTNCTPKTKRFMDLWFFSSSKNMDRFAKIVDNIENLNKSCSKRYDPHSMSYLYVQQLGIPVEFVFYRNFDYDLYRAKVLGVLE